MTSNSIRGAPRQRQTNADITDLPATISVEHAGSILGVSRRSAYRAVARGQIPAIRVGRRLLVPTAELLGLLGLAAGIDAAAVLGNE